LLFTSGRCQYTHLQTLAPKGTPVTERDKVIDQYFGDADTPIEWQSEEEKALHFWYDDLHCPNVISPMWFDVGGWWLTCAYMFRRFSVPYGKDWVAKAVNGYTMTAVVPRTAQEQADMTPYYNMVLPVYADKFLGWWHDRYLPEIIRNLEFLDKFDMEGATLPELMILLEDALDIQERHFRLHWILNYAQLTTSLTFQGMAKEMLGAEHASLADSILTSDEDRNWDSVRDLWKFKERLKKDPALRAAFEQNPTAAGAMKAFESTAAGRQLLKDIDAYKFEYGNKSMYTHEYTSTTWREDPTPIIEGLRGYLQTDYDYEGDVKKMREAREKAIEELWRVFPKDRPQADRDKLKTALDLAVKMTPLTPDHHFYMDQGTYARVRLVFLAIGRKLVANNVLAQADDVLFLKYDELRILSANAAAFDGPALVKTRRAEHAASLKKQPKLWAGTITQWSMYDEPYKHGLWDWPDVYFRAKEAEKQPKGVIKGMAASAGVVEGVVRIVHSAEQFDQVQKGEILVCKMTNPAWVVLFTKISGLVTDSGGTLSHPAVVSREFGLPAVVGTMVATQRLKTGQRVRVDGAKGTVEVLS
jgi:phosphohistidine swiveling domain-containing protein